MLKGTFWVLFKIGVLYEEFNQPLTNKSFDLTNGIVTKTYTRFNKFFSTKIYRPQIFSEHFCNSHIIVTHILRMPNIVNSLQRNSTQIINSPDKILQRLFLKRTSMILYSILPLHESVSTSFVWPEVFVGCRFVFQMRLCLHTKLITLVTTLILPWIPMSDMLARKCSVLQSFNIEPKWTQIWSLRADFHIWPHWATPWHMNYGDPQQVGKPPTRLYSSMHQPTNILISHSTLSFILSMINFDVYITLSLWVGSVV